MFELKEKVVYPGHGVAVVNNITEKQVSGNAISFFELRFLHKDMTVLAPVNNAEHMSIRKISTKEEVEKVFTELKCPPERRLATLDFTPSGWNKRNKDYQVKIEGGLLIDLARIYRDLMFVAKQKDLSFGERALLQTTEELISQEIEVVLEKTRDEVLQEIRGNFQNYVTFSAAGSRQTTSSI